MAQGFQWGLQIGLKRGALGALHVGFQWGLHLRLKWPQGGIVYSIKEIFFSLGQNSIETSNIEVKLVRTYNESKNTEQEIGWSGESVCSVICIK